MTSKKTAGLLLTAMILLSIVEGFCEGLLPVWVAGCCVWLAGALLAHRLDRFQVIQVSLMSGVGGCGIVWALMHGETGWQTEVIAGNHSLIAMLAAVTFLRLVTTANQGEHDVLPRGPRAIRQTLVAAHLFGAVINISAAIIIGLRIAQHGRLTPLQAKAVSRPFVAGAMWSPFFAAMAVVVHYYPTVNVPVISGIGLTVALLLMAYCAWELPRDPNADSFVGYPLHLEALRTPALLSLLVLFGSAGTDRVSMLTLVTLASMGLVVAMLLLRERRSALRRLRAHVFTQLPEMSGELALFLAAAVMSAGIGAAVKASGIALQLNEVTATTASLLLALLILLAVAGIHLVISISALASFVTFGSADPNLIGAAFLLAWGLGLVISPFSGTTLALQGRFGVKSTDFLRWNLGYVGVGYVIAVAVLHLYASAAKL